MTQQGQRRHSSTSSRRRFLKDSTAVAVGGAVAGTLAVQRSAHAGGGDVLRVGLIGCGGRGTGAASQALAADQNVKLTAMGDAFSDRLDQSQKVLLRTLGRQYRDGDLAKSPEQLVDVPADRRFVGFDAYRQVIDSGVDVVLLATPPHFRPAHLAYAVEQGKHVFCEKPVAVDAPGVRRVLATAEAARKKNLSIVSGLCWRYDEGMRDTFARVHEGMIGQIAAMQVTYNTVGLWHKPRQEGWSDMEWQLRNWLYFTWLSGDHNVEQHVHSLDKAAWAMHEEPPVRATGVGGRQVRTDPKYGHIFDHHAVVYEYANGVRLFSTCRQQDGCSRDVSDHFFGTQGRCDVMAHRIEDHSGKVLWRRRGKKLNMYQVEHNELFASIRSGSPINNGLYMARSTMLAILGRMATYTGQTITWDQAIHSKEDLTPPAYEWGSLPVPPVPRPGLTPFV